MARGVVLLGAKVSDPSDLSTNSCESRNHHIRLVSVDQSNGIIFVIGHWSQRKPAERCGGRFVSSPRGIRGPPNARYRDSSSRSGSRRKKGAGGGG